MYANVFVVYLRYQGVHARLHPQKRPDLLAPSQGSLYSPVEVISETDNSLLGLCFLGKELPVNIEEIRD